MGSLTHEAIVLQSPCFCQWAFEALVINEFEGTSLTCTDTDRTCYAVSTCAWT